MYIGVIEFFKKRFWVSRLPKNGRRTVSILFNYYTFYTRKKVKAESIKMFDQIKSEIDNKRTLFVNITKSFYGGSDIFLGDFWQANELYGSTLKSLNIEALRTADTIVIVDDILGTGDSLIRQLKKLSEEEELKGKDFIAVSVLASKESVKNVNRYVENNNINFKLFYNTDFSPAFKDGYIFKNMKHQIEYNKVCNELGVYEYRYGYDDSQALCSFYYNTPNNTLGLFWSDENQNKPYYKRHKKRYSLSSIKKKTTQHRIQAHKFDTSNPKEYKKILILVYLCENGIRDISKLRKRFGMNHLQVISTVDEYIGGGYIQKEDDKITLTKKGHSFINKETYSYVKKLF